MKRLGFDVRIKEAAADDAAPPDHVHEDGPCPEILPDVDGSSGHGGAVRQQRHNSRSRLTTSRGYGVSNTGSLTEFTVS